MSGHPGRPELVQMYEWVRPKIVVPVHGEARHFACATRAVAWRAERGPAEEGDVIRLAPGEETKIDEVRVGRLILTAT